MSPSPTNLQRLTDGTNRNGRATGFTCRAGDTHNRNQGGEMSELKPCPFCGTQLDPQENQAVWDSEQFYEHPKVEDCHLSGLMFPEKFWNTRSIED